MVVDLTEKSLVVQSNRLIEAKYRLSVEEQKIVKILVAQIQKDDVDFKDYEFRIKDLAEMLGMEHDNPYVVLRTITKKLLTRVLEFYNPETEKLLQASWLSSAEYHKGQGTVALCFDPKLKPLLFQLQSYFTKYELGQVMKFRGQYTIRFFELQKSFIGRNKKEVTFNLKELREILGLEKNEYKVFQNFKTKVLESARNEMLERNGKTFSWEPIKQGRGGKVIGVRLLFDDKNRKEPDKPVRDITKEEQKQVALVTDLKPITPEVEAVAGLVNVGVSLKTAQKLAVKHGAEKVREKIELAEQKKDVKNKAGFIWSALVWDWKDSKAEQKKREQEQEEERRNESKKLAERTKIIQEWKDEYRAFTRSIVNGVFNSLGESEKELLRSQFLAEQPAMKQFLGAVFGIDKGAFHAFVAKKFASQIPTVDEFLRDKGFNTTLEDMKLWKKV